LSINNLTAASNTLNWLNLELLSFTKLNIGNIILINENASLTKKLHLFSTLEIAILPHCSLCWMNYKTFKSSPVKRIWVIILIS